MSKRGFGSMDPEKHRKIASMGGKAAQAKGNSHNFTPKEAALAGAKGGAKVSQDREHMRRIGKLGGQARAEQSRLKKQQEEAKHLGGNNG